VSTHADHSCPEPTVLGAFIDGALPHERAQEITRHVSLCATCRALVESACEVEHDLEHEETRPAAAVSMRFRWLGALVAAIAFAVLGIAVIREWNGSDRRDPIARLVAASPRSVRTIESRAAGGFPWAPPRSLRRMGASEKTPDELVASGVAGSVLRELEGKRTPEALHAAGVAYLVAGDARTAVGLLQDAAVQAQENARVWCDLSAALYASATPDDRIVLTRALDSADHAIRLDPHLLEAHFNRALILERVGTAQQAAAAWTLYLQRDPVGPWAAEAQRHLTNLLP
jgi:hypothetical protein